MSDNNLPKLYPNENLKFRAKDKLSRAEILDYEGSDFELQCIAAAECNEIPQSAANDKLELIRYYAELKLKPDENIKMMSKQSLKKSGKLRLLICAASVAVAAATILYAVFLTENANNETETNAAVVENHTKRLKMDTIIENRNTVKQRPEPMKIKQIAQKPKPVENHQEEPAIKREYFAYELIRQKTAEIDNAQTSNINVDVLRNITSEEKYVQIVQNIDAVEDDEETNDENGASIRNFLTNKLRQTIRGKAADKLIAEWIIKNEGEGSLEIYPSKNMNTTVMQEYDENGKLVATKIFTSKDLSYDLQYASK
ncbi:MAG: hypothetical protein LBC98_05120 [Prevotellaceae bacterium]|jgi:hypothetical protein|nr:hypothetical protein [Prevotellaceae bacterium]